ncbi:acyl-CoA dehydrogenase [Mycolicibacterium aromaticivorans JS19b1 = JCM 16368]|uniref:Acyl-CoA dehydrogenase n=1 Tax=Mycolicibacterium aromaticivorans JS19b1 = JCM 16368 TaxID=1440774 RepID=A0A064CLP9_9MYCO|nr:acyl-CoA dehydrogenase family protein [Mycolicibacterium aromaticivorans]KDF01256.1 acyl-CoA dehydrogenase [Mycolicibacterium aromaticivorans JS19b1 = JCM 16368]
MDARLTSEQQQLRDAAARLADDFGPGSVADLDDQSRRARLAKTVDATGWRSLRSDGASGVEVALVAEEFARGLVDVPFLGPVLADDLYCLLAADPVPATIAVGHTVIDADGSSAALRLAGTTVESVGVGAARDGADLTRITAAVSGSADTVGELTAELTQRWYALALAVTTADLVGAARGTLTLATEYAKVREQYGSAIGSYQAVAHMLAEGLALIEGSVSVLRHAAWAVDELPVEQAVEAGRVAKIYCARAALAVCEMSIQVHGGIGNTWECLAHVYLRRVLAATEAWPVKLEELTIGLS